MLHLDRPYHVVRVVCLLSIFITGTVRFGCQPASPPRAIEPTTRAEPAPPPLTNPAQAQHWEAWEESPHAHTYDLEKGPNTYCAKCHSPANWDPSAKIDDPPQCVSCKFAFEPSPRTAKSNPLVPEEDWANIDCAVCHRIEHGLVASSIAWFDKASGYYETVASPTALCEKCHLDNETLRHKRDLGDGAHADFTCTDCHNAHTTRASCADCHDAQAIADVPAGHDLAHASVACATCHDASGLEVAPLEDGSLWMPFRTRELLGRVIREPYQSHHIQLKVDCQRCHFRDNPWNLDEVE